jgi:phosphatidylglycerophosphatase A
MPGAEMNESRRPDLRFLLSSPAAFVGLGFGTGLSPVAPGTVGSLLAFPVYWALDRLPLGGQIGVWLLLCVLGIWACHRAGQALGAPDHEAIVWDEVCGMALVLILGPAAGAWSVAGFLAFRAFDILKPWPIDVIDRGWRNGFGVMADDLVAAAYAILLIRFLFAIFGTPPP